MKDLYLRPRKLGGRIDRENRRSERPLFFYALIAFIAIACMVIAALGVPHILRTPVTVSLNGQAFDVPYGATILEAASSKLEPGQLFGRLLAVDGSVLDEYGGATPDFQIRGRARLPDTLIRRPVSIAVIRGADVTEGTITEEFEVEPELIIEGGGPFRRVAISGRVGTSERTVGETSGIEVSVRELVEPRPVKVERSRFPRGEDAPQLIALTFDDGPHPDYTPALLDVLRAENVRATFFLLGMQAQRYPDIVRSIVEDGHQIANHSYNHRDHRDLTYAQQREDFLKAQDLIEEAAGLRPTWVRPPYGMAKASTYSLFGLENMMVAHWTIDPVDWRRPGTDTIRDRVVTRAHPGAVVLLHDAGGNRNQTVNATCEIIRELKEEGYSFLTVEELYARTP